MTKKKVTFMNFELDVDAEEFVEQISLIEKERIEKTQLFTYLLDHTSDGHFYWHISTWQPDSPDLNLDDYHFFCPRLKAQLGYGEEELENKHSTFSFITKEGEHEKFQTLIKDHAANTPDDIFQIEMIFIHKDSSERNILVRAYFPEFDGNGNPTRLLGIHIDTTDID